MSDDDVFLMAWRLGVFIGIGEGVHAWTVFGLERPARFPISYLALRVDISMKKDGHVHIQRVSFQ